jgi:hypothetical protein
MRSGAGANSTQHRRLKRPLSRLMAGEQTARNAARGRAAPRNWRPAHRSQVQQRGAQHAKRAAGARRAPCSDPLLRGSLCLLSMLWTGCTGR